MPKILHNQLERRANKLGLSGEKYKAYIYGTLNKIEKKKDKKIK
jgi:hypothetical protein